MNIDANQSLQVRFREPRAGSCITPELLQELSSLIVVEAPEENNGQGACTSKDTNNLASLDAEGCVLVPAALLHQEGKSWVVSTGAEVAFTMPSGFDATQCFLSFWAVFGSTETGTPVRGETDANAATDDNVIKHIWPTVYLISAVAATVTLNIKNATQDATIYLQALKVPIAPQQA